MPPFIHLRARTAYSLAEGAITLDELAALCIKHRMPAAAATDSNNMFGALEFSLEMAGKGIQPIVGTTLHIVVDDESLAPVPRDARSHPIRPRVVELPLLAQDETGYANLLDLISEAYSHSCADVPASSLSRVAERSDGVICLSGAAAGPIGALLKEGRDDAAFALAMRFKDMFGDRFYMELQRVGGEADAWVEKAVRIAGEADIPLVATNDAYFPDPGYHAAHDALLCIADGAYLEQQERRRVSVECHFKSPRAMRDLFADLPEAIENTVHIAKRCAFMAGKRAPILPTFDAGGLGEADELRRQAHEGLEERLTLRRIDDEEKRKAYFDRLEFELGVIIGMKFPGYFLIVSDFIKWGKNNSIPIGPGRGSGAGSMVAWALKITDLDPIRFGLLFERFLNPERVSMPDFDIDFCQERREEVIRYVQRKYGVDRVAQIITFGKLQARAVLRDVGRVMQLPYNAVDRICKMIPFNPAKPITLQEAIDQDKNLRAMQSEDPEIARLMTIGLKLEGLYRHASTHAAGVIIGDRPLKELAPVYRDPRSDMQVCGFSMKYAEYAGLVKFDFLGLKTLTVVAKTVELIEKTTGRRIDMATIPLDDPKSYKMLSDGDSVGVFQVESAGMRDALRKLKPDNIDDIIALISLYRPGPMENIPVYIECKHGRAAPDYYHPLLQGILRETYGVFIYQEQVMQAAQVMAGYTLGGADLLRRAMGKKIKAEMDAQRKLFIDGSVRNGVDKDKASEIFDVLDKFAGYGFNKSHAAAYALISYHTAYLKANYPVEFLAASANLEIDNSDKIAVFMQQAKLHAIPVFPPDINRSHAYFMPETGEDGRLGIRYGLAGLKNVGVGAVEKVAEERKKNGKFRDIYDFFSRVPSECVNKRLCENMFKAGAFDALHPDRAALVDSLEALSRYGAAIREEKASAQASLFGGGGSDLPKPAIRSKEGGYSLRQKAQAEFDAFGFFMLSHPLAQYNETLRGEGVIFSDRFDRLPESGKATVAGVVTGKKIKSSPRGRFAIIDFSDEGGMFEVSIYNETLLDSHRDALETGALFAVDVHVRKEEGNIRLTADALRPLDEEPPRHIVLRADGVAWAEPLKKLLGEKKGRDSISVICPLDGKPHKIMLGGQFCVKGITTEDISNIGAEIID
ncbi:MAG: DNA polymerase III subunit alpha [Rickettsiales bacterium]